MIREAMGRGRRRPLAGLVLGAALLLGACGDDRAEIPYSELKHRIVAGDVAEVRLSLYRIDALPTAEAREAGAPESWMAVPVPGDDGLAALLDESGVTYGGLRPPGPRPLLIVPLLLGGGLLLAFTLHQQRRRARTGVGGLRVRDTNREGVGVNFGQVAGADEAKAELVEVVEFLRRPEKFVHLGARAPRGVLLVGPPGTGKTLLARAVAGEAGVPFFSISGSEFVEMYVGVGASRVRKLFERARAKAPCIVFIDELDAAGKARGGSALTGNDEREQTLNQLLVEMDGFDSMTGIVVVAATNRPEILDSALLRPGRFDRQVTVDRPDRAGREAILLVHARTIRLDPDVDLAAIAARTPGFVGADLANLLNEAALLAARIGLATVSMVELDGALDRITTGLERRSRPTPRKELRIVAYHEAGHALVAEWTPAAEPVRKVSIVPRGSGALGFMQQTPDERNLLQEDELTARLAVLLGGRAAERIVFGQVSTGASNDLERATGLARRMVCEFGMSPGLGPVAFTGRDARHLASAASDAGPSCSEATAREIDAGIRALLHDAEERAGLILERHVATLEAVAGRLLEDEVLDREALLAVMAEQAGPT